MLIGPGEGLIPIDFVFFSERVKVTWVFFVKKGFRSVSWEVFNTKLFNQVFNENPGY